MYFEMMVQMDSLFHTKSKNTYKEFKKYVLTLSKKRMLLTILLTDAILFAIGTITKNYLFYISLVIIPIMEYLTTVVPSKKAFYSNKLAVDAELDYDFYETHFVKTSSVGTEKVEYSKLLKVIETKTNFYLMIALNQGYMLKKADMPQGLDVFLRNLDSKSKK